VWERKWEARCLGLLGMGRVARAGDPLRARAGTCGGSARGPTSGWKVPRQGCREGVCGCAGLIRSEELVLGAASWEQTRGMRTHSVCRARAPFCEHRASVINSSYFKNLFRSTIKLCEPRPLRCGARGDFENTFSVSSCRGQAQAPPMSQVLFFRRMDHQPRIQRPLKRRANNEWANIVLFEQVPLQRETAFVAPIVRE
jgi:hypothetical protein